MSPETHAPRPLWTPALPRSVLLPLAPVLSQLSAAAECPAIDATNTKAKKACFQRAQPP